LFGGRVAKRRIRPDCVQPVDVLSYFHLRRTWDKQEYGTLTSGDIECLNDAKKRFEGQGF
jgi:hypothetical protein